MSRTVGLQPDCYGHCGRKAAVGRMFCSVRCAGEWADILVRGNEDHWCVPCREWKCINYEDRLTCGLTCGHVRTEIVEGMTYEGARQKYNAALDGEVAQAESDRVSSEMEEAEQELNGVTPDPSNLEKESSP